MLVVHHCWLKGKIMTTVATRVRRIADLEGFDLIVVQNGVPIDPAANGILGPYSYEKMAKHGWSVNDWKVRNTS
jgi:hypothetical protein